MAALDPELGHIAPTQALLAASRQNAVSFTPFQYQDLQPTLAGIVSNFHCAWQASIDKS
jgi:hypothetical protein